MSPHAGLGRQTNQGDEDTDGRECGTDGVDHRQDLVAVRDDEKSDETDGVEDEEQLPRGGGPVRLVERHRGRDQGGETKIDGQGDGPVPDQPGPAGDKGEDGPVSGVGELEGPVVRSGRGRVPGGKLAEREGDTFIYDQDDNPAQKHW